MLSYAHCQLLHYTIKGILIENSLGGMRRTELVSADLGQQELALFNTLVTNLTGRGKHLYGNCARGCMENLIMDMKLTTRSDKTACSRWQANQFRLFLHMDAYWLLHSLRLAAPTR